MKKIYISVCILLLALVVVACSDNGEMESQNNEKQVVTEKEKQEDEKIIAIVNGEEIKGVTYNLVYSQLKLHSEQIGNELEEEEIKDATIESIIDRQILMQKASDEGIEITKEETDKEFERLKAEGEQSLNTLLEQYQLTEEGFKDQLMFEMTMNEFMKQEIEVTVTDEEVKEVYEKAKEENENMPEFEEIKSSLKKQIEQGKIQEELQARIDKEKENADIDVKI